METVKVLRNTGLSTVQRARGTNAVAPAGPGPSLLNSNVQMGAARLNHSCGLRIVSVISIIGVHGN